MVEEENEIRFPPIEIIIIEENFIINLLFIIPVSM